MNATTGKLDRLLSELEMLIDLDHADQVEDLHLKAIHYQSVPFLPLTVICPNDDQHQLYPYAEAFDDPEKMLYNELLWSFSSIYNSIRIKDYFPWHIRSNHGVGILSSLFGATCRIVNDNMPWVDHLDGLPAIKRTVARGIPEYTAGLGGKVIETYQFYRGKLQEYPKCLRAIKRSQPDLQGPFDIAHLLVGTDLFYDLHDCPELVHELLDLITLAYIGFRRLIDPLLNDQAGDHDAFVHGAIFGGRVLIKDDTAAVTLSEDLYNTFSKTYNDRILTAFSGGSIHCCGVPRPWHDSQMQARWLRGINYGNPELHNLGENYQNWSQNGVPIIWWGYNQDPGFLREVGRLKIQTGMTLACKTRNRAEAREIVLNHTEGKSAIGSGS